MSYSRTIAAAVVVVMASACASEKMPTEQLAVATKAIDAAVQAGATQYAAADLAVAREKLQRAQNGAQTSTLSAAQVAYLAQEAEADANLAHAEAQAGKANAAVQATQADLDALREEAERAANAPIVPSVR